MEQQTLSWSLWTQSEWSVGLHTGPCRKQDLHQLYSNSSFRAHLHQIGRSCLNVCVLAPSPTPILFVPLPGGEQAWTAVLLA